MSDPIADPTLCDRLWHCRMGGAETARALRAMSYTGLLLGMTGDPLGCDERYAFEASGLDACLDKSSAGMAECVKLMKLHAARLLVDAERTITASWTSDAKPRASGSSTCRRSPASSGGWFFGGRWSSRSTATQETSPPMRSRSFNKGSEGIQGLSARIARVSRSTRPSSRVEPVEWSSSPLARGKRYHDSPATSRPSYQQTESWVRSRQEV